MSYKRASQGYYSLGKGEGGGGGVRVKKVIEGSTGIFLSIYTAVRLDKQKSCFLLLAG